MAFEDELGAVDTFGSEGPIPSDPPQILYAIHWADPNCKKGIALIQPRLFGVPTTIAKLGDNAKAPDCYANVACLIDANSPQCIEAGGGYELELRTALKYAGPPDSNGCTIYGDEEFTEPKCECRESSSYPGCYVTSITADEFTKLVNAPGAAKVIDGGKPDDIVCGIFKKEKQCDKKGGDACVWGKDGCVGNGGFGDFPPIGANEAVVGADVIGQQSNSGNGMTDMPLASVAMMLLSLYYALKW